MDPVSQQKLLDRATQAWRERPLALKAVSFGLVGIVNSIVDFGIFAFCYYVLVMPIVAANIVAWSIAVSGSYVLNSMITFAAVTGRKLSIQSYGTFVLSQVAGFFANTATVFIASYVMPVLVGKLLAIGASFVVNFSLSHFVVFRQRER